MGERHSCGSFPQIKVVLHRLLIIQRFLVAVKSKVFNYQVYVLDEFSLLDKL